MDGWEDDDVFTDEAFDSDIEPTTTDDDPPTLNTFKQHHEMSLDLSSPPPPPPAAAAADNNNATTEEDGWSDDDSNEDGILGRAAGAFGAALLASMDQEAEEELSQEEHEQQQQETSFGFGGGFVMKGLRGFIDAATAPQKDEDGWSDDDDALDLDEDGWSDKDDELEDSISDEVNPSQEVAVQPKLQEEVIGEPELIQDDPSDGGWDDDFVLNVSDVNTDSQIETSEHPPPGNVNVSDSLKDFVAKAESTLNSAFDDATKTPTRTPRVPYAQEDETLENNIFEPHVNKESAVASKSLTDFVDNLDAELNELKGSFDEMDEPESSAAVEPSQTHDDTYNFESDKNNSPEPIDPETKKLNVMPHQDSWYINAMEGGAGGIVDLEKVPPTTVVSERNDYTLPIDESSLVEPNDLSETPVGMPISEMPSAVNSEKGSNQNLVSSNGFDTDDILAENTCIYDKSELQCKCLELILPHPDNGNGTFENSGYGTKTLSDGTTVLVNYEKLLLNEATKRILLQRSVETYERTTEKLKTRYNEAMQTSKAHQESQLLLQSQLDEGQNENSKLRELVAHLEKEKEQTKVDTPSSEAHLSQEELLADANEKDRLEKLAQDLQEQLRLSHGEQAIALEARTVMSTRLEKTQAEQSRLEELMQMLQSDLSEAHQTCSLLQSENDALQQELNAKAVGSVEVETHDQTSVLNEKVVALENQLQVLSRDYDMVNEQTNDLLSEQAREGLARDNLKQENDALSSEIAQMRELLTAAENEKESQGTMLNDFQARTAELTAMVESMDNSSTEVDRLAAENASLTYELEMKSTENDKHVASLTSLQAELDAANVRLSANDSDSREIETSLRAENDVLKTNVVQSQANCNDLKQSKLELESTLEEQRLDINRLNNQIVELQSQVAEAANLQSEIVELQEAISGKDKELQQITSANEELNAQLIANNNDQQLAESREEVSTLRTQYNEFQQHHNTTMEYMEEQMSGLMQNNSALNSQLEECRNDLERAQHENSELVRLHSELKQAQSNGNTDSTRERLRVQELENDKTQLHVMLDQLQLDLNLQRQSFGDLSQEYDEIRSTLERVQMEHGNMLARNRALEQDNKSLEFQLRETSTKSNQLAATHRALEQDKQALEFQLIETSSKHEQSEARIATLQAQMDDQEQEALNAIAEWERRCSSLEKTSRDISTNQEVDQLQQEISTLTIQVQDLTSQLESAKLCSLEEREKLHKRIAELEQELNDEHVNELRDELTSLHEERQQLDLDNEELLVQLGLMQQSKLDHDEELQDEVTKLRGQVATLQYSVEYFKNEVDDARGSNAVSENVDDLSEVVENLSRENADLQSNISRLSSEKTTLEDEINNLSKTVKALEQQLSCVVSKNDDELSVVVEKLHRENTDLQNNISRLDSEKSTLEDDIDNLSEAVKTLEKELNTRYTDTQVQQLQTQIQDLECKLKKQQQDGAQLHALEAHVQDLEEKLSQKEHNVTTLTAEMKHALEQKDSDILKLTAEGHMRETNLRDIEREAEAKNIVSSMPKIFEQDFQEEKNHDLEDDSLQDLLADDIESDDYLRHQIVVLAQALERAELSRADLLDRLTRERKSNADSLKQLGESLKKFYSTVRST